jgi:hypothetical protein
VSLRSRVVTALFIVLQAFAALTMVGLSVHGVAGQAIAAPIYFLVAAGVTLWVGIRVPATFAVAGVGLLLLLGAPGVIAVLGYVERVQYERRVAATRVSDVRDEPIVSASGRTIGVRLTYAVSVPKRGYFGIVPTLSAPGPRNERLRLESVGWTVDGSREPVAFQPGRSHRMVVELYPPILFVARDKRCLQSSLVPPLPDGVDLRPLRIVIYESTFGDTYRGGSERFTRGSYDLAELYRGVLAEGLPPC